MKVDLRILIPGCCKGGTKPIGGAVLLGNEKILLKFSMLQTGNVIWPALASS